MAGAFDRRKTLVSPIYGGGGPVDSGKARSHRVGGGLLVFHRKTRFSEYLHHKYSEPPVLRIPSPAIEAGAFFGWIVYLINKKLLTK